MVLGAAALGAAALGWCWAAALNGAGCCCAGCCCAGWPGAERLCLRGHSSAVAGSAAALGPPLWPLSASQPQQLSLRFSGFNSPVPLLSLHTHTHPCTHTHTCTHTHIGGQAEAPPNTAASTSTGAPSTANGAGSGDRESRAAGEGGVGSGVGARVEAAALLAYSLLHGCGAFRVRGGALSQAGCMAAHACVRACERRQQC